MNRYHDQPPSRVAHIEPPGFIESVGVIIPECAKGAEKYVKSRVHIVRRPDGSIGHQVVNDLKPGASLLPIDVVNGHGYVILGHQFRYPHVDPSSTSEYPTLEAAARAGKIGRVSLEIPSGGIENGETAVQAALREAREEAGIHHVREDQLLPLALGVKAAVSVNSQEFNIFAAKLEEGQWQPWTMTPDIEEHGAQVAAYRLDAAIPEMINRGQIWEMSTILAINSLWRLRQFRQYL